MVEGGLKQLMLDERKKKAEGKKRKLERKGNREKGKKKEGRKN